MIYLLKNIHYTFKLSSRFCYGKVYCSNLKMDIKTFIFLDLETTGLPHLENNRTRVTELCLTAVRSNHIASGVFPRIQNKITLCLNPGKMIDAEASKITGLSNYLLEYQPIFDEKTFCVINDFINLQQMPVCFVAHNGNRFDYPILKAEIQNCGNQLLEHILCVDSLIAFKALHHEECENTRENINSRVQEVPLELQDGFDDLLCSVLDEVEKSTSLTKISIEEIQKSNETTPLKQVIKRDLNSSSFSSSNVKGSSKRKIIASNVSFKLCEVYKRLTSTEPKDLHRAECDVEMLIECAAVLGENFVNWCNLNARQFCDIPVMKPGKRIS